MLNRNPPAADQQKPFVIYCNAAKMELRQRALWTCIGQNTKTKHLLYRRKGGMCMLLTPAGKRVSESTALEEVANVLWATLRDGCCESAVLPKVKP